MRELVITLLILILFIGGKVGIGFGFNASPTKFAVDAGSNDGIQTRTSSNSTKAFNVYNTNTSTNNFLIFGDGKTNIGYQSSAVNQAFLNVNVATSQYGAVNAIDVFDQTSNKVNFRVNSFGYVYCRELSVKINTATFPDFVFDKNYRLMTLDERENYLKANKHLPYILGADSIKNGDAPIGEIMTGILQNTEELTIYLIELNKKLNALELQNLKLKVEIELLKKQN